MDAVLSQYGNRLSAKLAAAILWGLFGTFVSVPAFAESKVHTVTIEGMKFSPDVLEMKAGDTVVWKNKDIVPHNVTAENRSFHSPTISLYGTWKFKVRKKGEYPYLCTLHPTMKAKLIVH